MPVRVESHTTTCLTFRNASELPRQVWDSMRKDPRSNIILPTADKALIKERQSQGADRPNNGEYWIVCYTATTSLSTSLSRQVPDFVLTVNDSPLGKTYPIFLWTPRAANELTGTFLKPRIQKLVAALRKNVKNAERRVFSVFALDAVTRTFAESWEAETGVSVVEEPYYHANFTYCHAASLAPADEHNDPDAILRPATLADLEQTSALCKSFAAESAPFILSSEDALREARSYTTQQQLWVYEDAPSREITCIVAVTRKSTGVAAITKVFTDYHWRGKGCAVKLVRHVTDHLLNFVGMQRTVLYVAHSNVAASKVYHRVGYKGLFLEDGAEATPLVESWLELGFDRERVDLGHW